MFGVHMFSKNENLTPTITSTTLKDPKWKYALRMAITAYAYGNRAVIDALTENHTMCASVAAACDSISF